MTTDKVKTTGLTRFPRPPQIKYRRIVFQVDGDSKKIVFQLIHAGTPPLILQTDNLSSAERYVFVS